MEIIDEELREAAKTGNVEFLQKCVDDNKPNHYYLTLFPKRDDDAYHSRGNIFHIAACEEQEEWIREAINLLPLQLVHQLICQPNPELANSNPLHVAAEMGNLKIVKMFLNAFTSHHLPHHLPNPPPWLMKDEHGFTPCHLALFVQKEECGLEILRMDKELLSNMLDDDGWSLLARAIQNGQEKVAMEIISSPNSFSASGRDERGKEICNLLLKKMPELIRKRDTGGMSIFHNWAMIGKLWSFECLLGSSNFIQDIRHFGELISATDDGGKNPLHYLPLNSISIEDAQIGRLLIDTYKHEHGEAAQSLSNISPRELQYPWLVQDNENKTPLDHAVDKGKEELAKMILAKDKNALKTCQENVLFVAIEKRFEEVVLPKILEIVNEKKLTHLLTNDQKLNALHLAPKCKRTFCERLIEQHPVLISGVSKEGETILHTWVKIGQVWPFEYLLNNSKIGYKWRYHFLHSLQCQEKTKNNNALHVVATCTNESTLQIVKLLVDAYKDLFGSWTDHYQKLALYLLSLQPDGEDDDLMAKWLNKERWSKYLQDSANDNNNVLHLASTCTDAELAQFLVEEAPEFISKPNKNGVTPLELACEKGATRIVKAMLEKGWEKDPSAFDEVHFAWIKACKNGHESVIQAFVDCCPIKFSDHCEDHNDTPLHHIKLRNLTRYEDFLKIQYMKDLINVKDSTGATPLHKAIENDKIFLAEALLKMDNIEYNIKDDKGKTAREMLAKLCEEPQPQPPLPKSKWSTIPSKGDCVKQSKSVLETQLRNCQRHQPNINCRVEAFGKMVGDFGSLEKKWVHEMGFEGLLWLRGRGLPRNLCYWLMTRLDPLRKVLMMPGGVDYPIDRAQVRWVFGLPHGPKRVPKILKDDERFTAHVDYCLSQFGQYVDGDDGKQYRVVNLALVRDRFLEPWVERQEMVFKTCFLALVLGDLLCPNQCTRFPKPLFPALGLALETSEYDWCQLVVDKLMDASKLFARGFYENGYTKGAGGCTYFLAILYLDHLNRPPIDWMAYPRVRVWTTNKVNQARSDDRHENGGDYGKIGCISVAYGQKHPLMAEDTMGPTTGIHSMAYEVAKLVLSGIATQPGGDPCPPKEFVYDSDEAYEQKPVLKRRRTGPAVKSDQFRGDKGRRPKKKKRVVLPDPFVGRYAVEKDYNSASDMDWGDVSSNTECESTDESLVESDVDYDFVDGDGGSRLVDSRLVDKSKGKGMSKKVKGKKVKGKKVKGKKVKGKGTGSGGVVVDSDRDEEEQAEEPEENSDRDVSFDAYGLEIQIQDERRSPNKDEKEIENENEKNENENKDENEIEDEVRTTKQNEKVGGEENEVTSQRDQKKKVAEDENENVFEGIGDLATGPKALYHDIGCESIFQNIVLEGGGSTGGQEGKGEAESEEEIFHDIILTGLEEKGENENEGEGGDHDCLEEKGENENEEKGDCQKDARSDKEEEGGSGKGTSCKKKLSYATDGTVPSRDEEKTDEAVNQILKVCGEMAGADLGTLNVDTSDSKYLWSAKKNTVSCPLLNEDEAKDEEVQTQEDGAQSRTPIQKKMKKQTTKLPKIPLRRSRRRRGVKLADRLKDPQFQTQLVPRRHLHMRKKIVNFVEQCGQSSQSQVILRCGDQEYIRVLAQLYTRSWQEKFKGTSVRIMLDPTLAIRMLVEKEHDPTDWISTNRVAKSCAKQLPSGTTADRLFVVFVPVLQNWHWWCAAFCINSEEIWVMDSMSRSPLQDHSETIDKLTYVMDKFITSADKSWVSGKIIEYTRKIVKVAHQEDGYSCGVYMLGAINKCAERFTDEFHYECPIEEEREWQLTNDLMSEFNEARDKLKELVATVEGCSDDEQTHHSA